VGRGCHAAKTRAGRPAEVFDELRKNRLALEALPEYLPGFLLALSFTQ